MEFKYVTVKCLMDCQKKKLHEACDALQKPRFDFRDVDFREEYMKSWSARGCSGCPAGGRKVSLLYILLFNSLFKKFKKLESVMGFCQPMAYALMGLEERFSTILDKTLLHAKNYVLTTSSHPYFKLKWFSSESRDVAVESLVEQARNLEDPKAVNQADRTERDNYFSGDK